MDAQGRWCHPGKPEEAGRADQELGKDVCTPEPTSFEFLSPKEIASFGDALEGICSPTFQASIERWPVREKVSILLAHAFIAIAIFQELLRRPFFFLGYDISAAGECSGSLVQLSASLGTNLNNYTGR